MRLPLENLPDFSAPSAAGRGSRDPVWPDHRQRVDSDVRAFLRQPSTPWIVFNRASRPFFPEAPAPAAEPSQVEPSNLIVARDVVPAEPPSTAAATIDVALPDDEVPPFARRSRGRVALIAGAALSVACALAFVATAAQAPSTARAAAAAPRASTPADPIAPAPGRATPPAPPTTIATPAAAPAPPATFTPAKARLGKLSIRGKARWKRVYIDHKLLLGSGSRSFLVRCGAHTFSIGHREGGRALNVPCNGELVIRK